MRVLVTGGAGYVGGFAARALLRAGHEIVVLDDLSEGHRAAVESETLVVGHIEDVDSVRDLLQRERIGAVMHFAGSCYVGESVRAPRDYYRNNVAGSLALLEAMVDCGVTRLVFSSSCAVYSEAAEMPLREDAPIDPASPYAFSKRAIERMIGDFARAYGLRHVILRYFNAAGADPEGLHGEDHEPEPHLIPLVMQVPLGQREKLDVYGDDYPTPDGTCIRDYVHVDDLAHAHTAALRALARDDGPDAAVYNLGTGTGNSVLEVIRCVERVTGHDVPYQIAPRRPGDTPRLVASSERARSELGWTPCYDRLEAIVETAWAWHRSHPGGYADR